MYESVYGMRSINAVLFVTILGANIKTFYVGRNTKVIASYRDFILKIGKNGDKNESYFSQY